MRSRKLALAFGRIVAAMVAVPMVEVVGCGGNVAPNEGTDASGASDTAGGFDVTSSPDAMGGPDGTNAPDASDAQLEASPSDASRCPDGSALDTCGNCQGQSVCSSDDWPRCMPYLGPDGGPEAGSDAGVSCAELCGPPPITGYPDAGWVSCTIFTPDGGSPTLECVPMQCLGRRPAGLVPLPQRARPASLGEYFAHAAHLEAASVLAFRHLRRELVAHRAPRRLVRAAERAARDEVRHARMMAAMARHHGTTVREPVVERRPVRSLEEIAIENVVEGCVIEGFGALVATWQSKTAEGPVVRAAMKRIARDETRHAALAMAIAGWAQGRLDVRARARVAHARRDALSVVGSSYGDVPAPMRGALGLPGPQRARALATEMAQLI